MNGKVWGSVGNPANSRWEQIQSEINTCSCRNDPLFVSAKVPARPPVSFRQGCLLLISEAPPETGGFWEARGRDSLRGNILTLLRDKGFQAPNTVDSQEAVDAFVAEGFFLVQTLKWPIANGKTYNSLGPAQKRRLIQHAALAHLQHEIETLAPKGVLAMGNAAWDACRQISQGGSLPKGGIKSARCKDLFINLYKGKLPLNATILPTDYNFNVRRSQVVADFEIFLGRHRWQAKNG